MCMTYYTAVSYTHLMCIRDSHPTERGVQFVTWEWDFDRKGVHHGH